LTVHQRKETGWCFIWYLISFQCNSQDIGASDIVNFFSTLIGFASDVTGQKVLAFGKAITQLATQTSKVNQRPGAIQSTQAVCIEKPQHALVVKPRGIKWYNQHIPQRTFIPSL
jgi:hypothetical protein